MSSPSKKNTIGRFAAKIFGNGYLYMAVFYIFAMMFAYASGTYSVSAEKDTIYELLSRDARASSNTRSHVEYHRSGSFTWEEIGPFYQRSATQTHPIKTYTYLATYALTSKNAAGEHFNVQLDDSVFGSNAITLPSVGYYNETVTPEDERYLMFNSIDLYRYKFIETDWRNVSNPDGYSFIFLSYTLADEMMAAKGYTSYDQLLGKNVTVKNGSGLNETLTIVNVITKKGGAKQIIDITGNFFISYNADIVRGGYTRFCSEFRSSVINIRDYFDYCYVKTWENADRLKSFNMVNGVPTENARILYVNNLMTQTINGINYADEFMFYLFLFLSMASFGLTLFFTFRIISASYDGAKTSAGKLLRFVAYSATPFALVNAVLSIVTHGLSPSFSTLLFFNFFGSKFAVISVFVLLFVFIIFASIKDFMNDCQLQEKKEEHHDR